MNAEIHKLSEWFKANKLSVNWKKTCFLIFHSRYNSNIQNITLKIDDIIIERKPYVKYLGIIIDDTFTWQYHLNNVKLKLSKSCCVLSKLKHYSDSRTLRKVYFSIVFPYLYYGVLCWGSAAKKFIKPLQVLQNKCLKNVLNLPYDSSNFPVYRQLKGLQINEKFD